jgi:hypothetical protein
MRITNLTPESFSPSPRTSARRVASLLLVACLLPVQNLPALTVTSVTSDNGLPALSVQWTDSAGLPRTAIMVNQSQTGAYQGPGYLRQLTYQSDPGTNRVCTGTDFIQGGTDEFSGDGFVQNHTGYDLNGNDDFSSANFPLVPGTTTVTLQGTSHAIITYNMPNYQIGGTNVPTTIQWFFADGRSHPIFAITQDARGLESTQQGNLSADSRSPYGDMAYDGDGVNAYVGGASYGDTFKFVTLAANEVTTNSGWKDIDPNSIPYAMQWANPATVDAEMGHVATLPITVYDQGSDSRLYPPVDPRNTSQLNGPMLTDESWAFQILNYQWPTGAPVPITTKRLTWGANFGRVGGFDEYGDYPDTPYLNITQYSQHSTDPVGEALLGDRADGMLMAYSVFVVFGTHTGGYTNGTVGRQVIQMQNVTHATLSASIGTVETSGPAGVGSASSATISYTPSGYDPTYSTWEIAATTNAVNATLALTANYPLDHPVFVINGYTSSQLPTSIAVGAGLTNAGVNYFATLDTAGRRLWITVNRLVTNSLNLVVNASGGGGGASPPAISSIPSGGTVGTEIVITGANFTGATAVAFNGVPASFTVNSATQITATVPAAATSGPITVTTPGGTAQSAASFTVLAAPASLPIYTNNGSLLNGFQDYSWATNVNYYNTSPIYSGSYSISVTAVAYTALSLYHDDFNTAPYASLSFWINSGAAGAQGLQVMGVVNQTYQSISNLPPLAANTWTQFNIPLSALGVANVTNCQGFWFWPTLAGVTTFYVASIQMNSATPPSLSAVSSAPKSGSFVLQLSGIPGQTYWIQTSTNLVTWTSLSTNTLASSSVNITNTVAPASTHQYWRAAWPQ